jgi:hypothetical protein
MSHLEIYRTSYGKKKSLKSNWQFDSRPPKVGNRPDPNVCKWSATCHWKALNNGYKFALDLIPIEGLSKELWPHKVAGVQIETFSRLSLGSLGIKSHSDVGAAERHKKYYMGEGDGFPRVRAMMSLVSPELPMACPSTKGARKNDLTNLLVGLMQVWVSKWGLSLFLVPSRSSNMPPLPPLVLWARERTPGSQHFHCLINLDSSWV